MAEERAPAPEGSARLYATLGRRLDAEPPPETPDLWDALADRVDVAQLRPQLAPDIEIKPFHLRWGNDYTMVANPRDLTHLRLEPGEAGNAQATSEAAPAMMSSAYGPPNDCSILAPRSIIRPSEASTKNAGDPK